MSLADNPANLLERYGTAATLRRRTVAAGANAWTEGAPTTAYYPQKVKSRHLEPDIVAGTVRDLGSQVQMSPRYEAPRVGDWFAEGTLVADGTALWREIVHVQPVLVGDVVAKYIVTVSR